MFFDQMPSRGLVCAHRGIRSIAPENTLLAMARAMACGAHCWETDIRVSKDGELIVFHDDSLERTTDIAANRVFQGCPDLRVDRFTLSELRELDAGSWFLIDDPFGTVASGEVGDAEYEAIRSQRIPLLREVLDFSSRYSFPVNLEIKDLKNPPGEVGIVDRIMEMLLETGTMDMVILSSFRHEYLHRARELNREVAIAVLAEKRHPPDLIEYLRSFSATAYHPNVDICDDELILGLQRAGFRVNCWTVNNMKQAQKILSMGGGVITDWPQRLIPLRS